MNLTIFLWGGASEGPADLTGRLLEHIQNFTVTKSGLMQWCNCLKLAKSELPHKMHNQNCCCRFLNVTCMRTWMYQWNLFIQGSRDIANMVQNTTILTSAPFS